MSWVGGREFVVESWAPDRTRGADSCLSVVAGFGLMHVRSGARHVSSLLFASIGCVVMRRASILRGLAASLLHSRRPLFCLGDRFQLVSAMLAAAVSVSPGSEGTREGDLTRSDRALGKHQPTSCLRRARRFGSIEV